MIRSFPEVEDPEVIYIDSMASDLFLEAEADVRRHMRLFDNPRAAAISPDDSSNLIAALSKDLQ
ncbi:hypothetical protein K6I34_005180 [Streptomyces sp. UNOC14_S4]|nr:hypothetical protein [Streptomyces sp. UNOC14_S4]